MKERHFVLLMLGIAVFLFVWQVGSLNFVDEDEATYAKTAQEMVTSGDWIYPRCNYTDFIDKPPLIYWGTAVSFRLFGKMDEFAIRFWHALVAVLGVLATYLIARELFGLKRALFSGLILLSSLQYFYQARMTLCDIPLTFFISLTLYLLLLFARRGKARFYYMSVIAAALAVLVKGPIGILIPALVAALYVFISGEKLFAEKRGFHLLAGLMLFFGIVSPWFIAQFAHYGRLFLTEFFIHTNIERAMHSITVSSKPDPFYFYIPVLIAGFLPWSGIMLYSAGTAARRCRLGFKELRAGRPELKNELFLLIWAGTVFVLFSVFGMKSPRYILPVFPPLAILTAGFFEEKEGPRLILPFLFSVILAPFIIGAVIAAGKFFPSDAALYLPILAPSFIILGAGIIVSSFLLFVRKEISFTNFLMTAFAAYTAFIVFAGIHYNRLTISKPFADIIKKTLRPEELIINYKPLYGEGFSPAFYANHRMGFVTDEQEILALLNSETKVYCITSGKDLSPIKEKVRTRTLDERMGRVLFTNRPESH